MPLILSFPGRLQPARVSDLVGLRDLPATILDLVQPKLQHDLPGASVAPGAGADGSPIVSGVSKSLNRPSPFDLTTKGPIRSLVDRGLHYIRYADPGGRWYRLARSRRRLRLGRRGGAPRPA